MNWPIHQLGGNKLSFLNIEDYRLENLKIQPSDLLSMG
jgi:hypothetical protein